jgi:DNA-nicking Smr family endonuclease
MIRRLSAEERALWRKLTASVRPLDRLRVPEPEAEPESPATPALPRPVEAKPAPPRLRQIGTSLDATWDRRLSRGLVAPDRVVDLHGHGLAAAHFLLERRLDEAIEAGARLVLLITGRPPKGEAKGEEHPVRRGVIRASVGAWLAASRHAGAIASIRNAHPRHGGAGALYVVLRRKR